MMSKNFNFITSWTVAITRTAYDIMALEVMN